MSNFAHLHVHTEFSLLDGAARIKDLVRAASEKGMNELAITDHGVMYGIIDFYKAAKEHGIKPIIGCEVYVAPRTMRDREPGKDQNQYHLVLLAENEQGYRNLVNLVSTASIEGFYYKPRVDLELLNNYSCGITALSACLAGEIPNNLLAGNYDKARETVGKYRDIFGAGSFYLELQDHGMKEQKPVNEGLCRLAADLGIPLVATNDVHYVERGDAPAHDVLLCIQTGKTLQDTNRMRFPTDQFYLKTEEEMEQIFGHIQDCLKNTKEIAERCCVDFDFNTLHLPHYQVPDGYTLDTYLDKLCREKIHDRFPSPDKNVLERLEYELAVIKQMGYSGYFLIVADLIDFARSCSIPVGPGRGSAAGSLVAYVLGITNINPLSYDLLFERFLNPERVTMPDIDTDFCFERRGEIIEYVSQKYGSDRVAQIVTFGTMAAKAAIRDVGRVMGLPYPEVDKIAKEVPNELGIDLERALKTSPGLQKLYREDDTKKRIIDMARAIEGLPRHASTHAAGVVISKEPLTAYVPLQKTSEDIITTQLPMNTVEELGLLKMDILGLRTLTVIGDTLERVADSRGIETDITTIPMDDAPTYSMLGQGESVGVFQLESKGMRTILKNMRPERFEDLIALVALYRPGPLGSGMVEDFIARKHGDVPVEYLHPSLEPILKETYGVILYQEQVMRIASEMSGFSLGKADLLRRAMGKKKPEIIAAQKKDFLEGARDSGIDVKVAAQIFDLMAHFAGYGFNKSHSAAYALIAYQTAYLKANYPFEFMASLLSSVMDNPDKVPRYMDECKRMGIQILPPDVNRSLVDFSVSEGQIRFGLAAVKNVGRSAIHAIIEARQEGPFESLQQFCERVNLHVLSKRVLESLIKGGAMDSLGNGRKQLLEIMDRCVEAGQRVQYDRQVGQVSLFDVIGAPPEAHALISPPQGEDFPVHEKLAMEYEILGFYVSGHPVENHREILERSTSHLIAELENAADGEGVVVGGIIVSVRQTITRRKETMAQLVLEDMTGQMDVILFPKAYAKYAELLQKSKVIIVGGALSLQEDERKLFADNVKSVEDVLSTPVSPLVRRGNLLLKLPVNGEGERLLSTIRGILSRYSGDNPVYIDFGDGTGLKVGRGLWVSVSQELISDLTLVCGEKNVVIKS